MKKNVMNIAYIAVILASMNACKKDKNIPPVDSPIPPTNSTELITTMKIMLYDTTAHSTAIYAFSDIDGAGGNTGMFSGTNQMDSVIQLTKNHVYNCSILLLDESKSPTDTISHEVKQESVDHMFFFNAINPTSNPYSVYLTGCNTTIKYLDLDSNNRGVGLNTLWIAPSVSLSKSPLMIELRHQPGIKNGTYAPGETDIQVLFKVLVN